MSEFVNTYIAEDASVEVWDLAGTPWNEAPIPRRWHLCHVQTYGWFNYFDLVERCACGAIRRPMSGRWRDKNSRRGVAKPKLREWIFAPILIFAAILSGLITAPHAKADGQLSAREAQYTARYGPTMVCQTIAAFPSVDGVLGVASVIMDDGFTADSTADIINASVLVYCDQYFPLLQAIGSKARAGDSKGMTV